MSIKNLFKSNKDEPPKYETVISFDNKYYRDLFEDWMSNLGEQLFDEQLDVEKENEVDMPKKLLNKGLIFDYPKKGVIRVKSIEE